jgi:ribonuclease-3
MMIDIEKLQKFLKYQFLDRAIVELALTHRSANALNNERLEFLGDSLLGFIVADILYKNYPEANEGELSRMRSTLVNKITLANIARELKLGQFVQLGSGESKSGGSDRDSILADAVEALIAAIYLDAGIHDCRKVVSRWLDHRLGKSATTGRLRDAKTQLQELMQASGFGLPQYNVVKIEGEAHQQLFHVECKVDGVAEPMTSSGTSKRSAEQGAALDMLQQLKSRH